MLVGKALCTNQDPLIEFGGSVIDMVPTYPAYVLPARLLCEKAFEMNTNDRIKILTVMYLVILIQSP